MRWRHNEDSPMHLPLRHALSALSLALLAACGGGGGGDGGAVAEPSGSTAGTTGGSSTGATGGSTGGSTNGGSTGGSSTVAGVSTGGDCGLANFQAELLARVNALRAAGTTCRTPDNSRSTVFAPGATALRWHSSLTQAALAHSQDMATRDYFSHTTLGGDSFDRRILAITGDIWRRLGENIAAGQGSVQEAVDDWTASYDHCLNLMNPAYTDIGVACVPRSGSARYSSYWTMDLGQLR
jgi:uncharacterized protein YkwD